MVPEGRKIGSLKRRVRGQTKDAKLRAVMVRSTFRSENVQNTPFSDHFWQDVQKVHVIEVRRTFVSQNMQITSVSDHFWKLRCRKSARHTRQPAAGQRRPRAPQLRQKALCTAPATRQPAAGQRRPRTPQLRVSAAPPRSSVHCACHTGVMSEVWEVELSCFVVWWWRCDERCDKWGVRSCGVMMKMWWEMW